MTKRVLFVCMGNICRSPAAEAALVRLVQSTGADIEVDSAGTIGIHAGERPDGRMRSAGEARGLVFNTRARQVSADDLQPGTFDLVIAMDRENLRDLQRLARTGHAHVMLMSDFLSPEWPQEVPDPYYGGSQGFETVLDMVEAACPAILKRLGTG
jgi:protein-tyrosine phosphatase